MDTLRDAALWYATGPLGWRVFPVGRDKRPLIKGWPERASNDPLQVSAWWRAHPGANIGAVTGHAFDVVDLDGMEARTAWDHTMEDLGLAGRFYPPEVQTGRDGVGLHLYFQPTGMGNKHPAISAHVDYRGRGGYVILPPSVHGETGRRYEWLCRPWHSPPPAMPPELRAALWPARDPAPIRSRPLPPEERTRAEQWAWSALFAIRDELANVPAGMGLRNYELNRLGFRAWQLAHLVGEANVEAALVEACTRNGYAESEPRTMRGTINSARKGLGFPRFPDDRGAS